MTTSDTTPDASDTSAAILPGEHLHALRSALRGPVMLPGDPEWDDARRAWQLLVDQHNRLWLPLLEGAQKVPVEQALSAHHTHALAWIRELVHWTTGRGVKSAIARQLEATKGLAELTGVLARSV